MRARDVAVGLAIGLLIATAVRASADELPYVPAPSGYVESTKILPELAQQAMIGQPPGYRIVGVYLLPTEATAMLQNTATDYLSTYCRAYLIHRSASADEARSWYAGTAASFRRSLGEPFDPNGPKAEAMEKPFLDALAQQGRSAAVDGLVNLGTILDSDDVIGNEGLDFFEAGGKHLPIVILSAVMRDGADTLLLTSGGQFTGKPDLARFATVMKDWVAKIREIGGR